jgi:hypothetical protein
MAQTKKKRRRKRRGTQGGRIDTRPARGRPRSRAEAQARARSRGGGKKKKQAASGPRTPQPASWSTASKKGGLAAVLFGGILALLGQSPVQIIVVAVVMLGFYVPLAFVMDRFMYQRHLRKEAQKRAEKDQQRRGGPQQAES